MRAALSLARRSLGRTGPNPAVGCVIARDGVPVGRGWTQPGGRPHAETEALKRAGAEAKGATAYVTLEPCAHHGKTPPCADALIEAGIARVVIPFEDPDPRVAGKGLLRLAEAGIATTKGVLDTEAREVNCGFLKRIQMGLPFVNLKLATTLDGRIATESGKSRWITGPLARLHVHRMRAEFDAVMIGAGTAIQDNPDLTCRLPGMAAYSPMRIVVDSRLSLPLTHNLVRTAHEIPTWILSLGEADSDRRAAFVDQGVEIILCGRGREGSVDLKDGLKEIAGRGISRLLVEGGGQLAAGLLRGGLVDALSWFHAPGIMGEDGIPAVSGLGVELIENMPRFRRQACQKMAEDMLTTYVRD